VFVLGAGINKTYGLPDWPELLEGLLRRSGRVRFGSIGTLQLWRQLQDIASDPLMQAAIVRQGYRDSQHWIASIHEHLREHWDKPSAQIRKPLYRIADLVMRQYEMDRHRRVSVLTFNYDHLLENALFARAAQRDRNAINAVSGEEQYASSTHRPGVFVYHLHGDTYSKAGPILDVVSYLPVLASPGTHWSWDCLTNNLFEREAAAMFLGLSLADPSLRLFLLQWAAKGFRLSGVYVAGPPPAASANLTLEQRLDAANSSSDIVELLDRVLEQLCLVPYHVTVWDELNDLLEVVAHDA
jgi:hypothetical protein